MINRRTFGKAVGVADRRDRRLAGGIAGPPARLRHHARGGPEVAGGHAGTHTSFASPKQVKAGLLDIGYAEAGPARGYLVTSLEANLEPLPPKAEHAWSRRSGAAVVTAWPWR
ncbi:hypothetical protein OHA25_48355 [Nonomuraea sp. NBC_00507]|uniref:hypothetical protein n=1 Tax=Nonomuraea sp. NBC_00507 TaxID=2976002 RepID=UPI002E1770B4